MKLSELIRKNAPKPIVILPIPVVGNWYENIPEPQTIDLSQKVIELEKRINKLEGEE